MLCGWDWRFHPEIHHYSLRGAFDLAPPRLGLMCATLLWPHLLCFAANRYKFWFWKFKQAVPEEDGWFYNRAERERAPRWELPCFSENWGRRGWKGGTREGEECLSSWSSSHLLSSCAAGWATSSQACEQVYVCVIHLMSNTWRIYSRWEECGLISQHTIWKLILVHFLSIAYTVAHIL